MRVLLLADGSGTELQIFVNKDDKVEIKMYTDIEEGIENIQCLILDDEDLLDLIKELNRLKKEGY